MKLWVDDERPMPEGFDYHAKTAAEAIAMIQQGTVTAISLDHDLGGLADYETGYFIAQFIEMAAHNGWIRPIEWAIHTANPVGRRNMEAALMNANKYWGI